MTGASTTQSSVATRIDPCALKHPSDAHVFEATRPRPIIPPNDGGAAEPTEALAEAREATQAPGMIFMFRGKVR